MPYFLTPAKGNIFLPLLSFGSCTTTTASEHEKPRKSRKPRHVYLISSMLQHTHNELQTLTRRVYYPSKPCSSNDLVTHFPSFSFSPSINEACLRLRGDRSRIQLASKSALLSPASTRSRHLYRETDNNVVVSGGNVCRSFNPDLITLVLLLSTHT